jgi:hypothetical protein
MLITPWGWGAPRPPVLERLEFLASDQVDSSSDQQRIDPTNEGKAVLKSKIERTTTDGVIQIDTSQVKLREEFNGLVVIDGQADTRMEDIAPDHREEKMDKVVDFKYLQPWWFPPRLTRTQKWKLQRLRLAEMREKEREKRRDKLFDKIKPRTLPKQEWRRKEAPQHPTAEPAAGGQTTVSGGQTAASTVPGNQTLTSGGQTAQAQEGRNRNREPSFYRE